MQSPSPARSRTLRLRHHQGLAVAAAQSIATKPSAARRLGSSYNRQAPARRSRHRPPPAVQALVMRDPSRFSRRDGDEAFGELKAIAKAGWRFGSIRTAHPSSMGASPQTSPGIVRAEMNAEFRTPDRQHGRPRRCYEGESRTCDRRKTFGTTRPAWTGTSTAASMPRGRRRAAHLDLCLHGSDKSILPRP